MLPLRTYEVQRISEFPSIEGDWVVFVLWGWTIFVASIVIDFVSGLLSYESRKRKLAAAKTALLPQFPNSLVCPKCQAVVKRL